MAADIPDRPDAAPPGASRGGPDASSVATLRVEFCVALPDGALRVPLRLPAGSVLRDAVEAGLRALAPRALPDFADFGVFGHARPPGHPLHDGDRVEALRPLTVDPKIARQRRVEKRRIEAGRGPWRPGR